MLGLVVGGDSNINELERSISISKRDNGNVDVRSFEDSLEIRTRIGTDNQTRFTERTGDVIGESTRSITTNNSFSTNVSGELKSGTVTVRTSRDNNDVLRLLYICKNFQILSQRKKNYTYVLNGSNDTGSQDKLLPGLTNVDQVDTYIIQNKYTAMLHK
jgi:hypothetical protein